MCTAYRKDCAAAVIKTCHERAGNTVNKNDNSVSVNSVSALLGPKNGLYETKPYKFVTITRSRPYSVEK
jgi:hypothetical protein